MFSWFVQAFAGLPLTYGSLSTVIAFMMWLWLSFTVVLAGAELDAAVEREAKNPAGVDACGREPRPAFRRKGTAP